jgi:hypothetical protein
MTAVLALVLASVTAHAQDDEATREWAREAYVRAEDAFSRGETNVALELFREIVSRTGNVSVQYNIAICYERLGELRRAHGEFRIVSESVRVPTEVRAAALEGATRVALRLGTIEIDAPANERAHVDTDQTCLVPCEVIVEPGRHTVRLEGDDGIELTVDVRAGEVRSVELARRAPEDPEVTLPVTDDPSLGGWTIAGAILAAIGGAGILGFGLAASDLHDEFQLRPTPERSSDGFLLVGLTNASIGVAGLGGILFAIDLVLLATWSPD